MLDILAEMKHQYSFARNLYVVQHLADKDGLYFTINEMYNNGGADTDIIFFNRQAYFDFATVKITGGHLPRSQRWCPIHPLTYFCDCCQCGHGPNCIDPAHHQIPEIDLVAVEIHKTL